MPKAAAVDSPFKSISEAAPASDSNLMPAGFRAYSVRRQVSCDYGIVLSLTYAYRSLSFASSPSIFNVQLRPALPVPLSLVAEAVRLVRVRWNTWVFWRVCLSSCLVAKSVCRDLFADAEIPQLPAEIRSNNRAFSSAIVPTLFYFIMFQAETSVIKIEIAIQVKGHGIWCVKVVEPVNALIILRVWKA